MCVARSFILIIVIKIFFKLRISLEIETNLLFIAQPTANIVQWIAFRGVEENMAERQSLMLAG